MAETENEGFFPLECENCKGEIPEGEIYSSRSHDREVGQGGMITVIHSEYTQVLCSDCSTFRGCQEEPAPAAQEVGARSFGRSLEGRERVVELLRKTANELEKGDDGLIRGVALVVAGADGAMLQPGPMTVVHVLREHAEVPKDLRDGIDQLPIELELLDVKGEA